MERITEFPSEVIKELGYYVYRLIDPRNGETFYVGKGKGNRVFQHVKGELSGANEEADELSEKLRTIKEIHNEGLEVIHIIHRHGMSEEVALEVEAALIDAYPYTTNIASGKGSDDYGTMNVLQIIKKYKAEDAFFKHRVVMITINRSINEKPIYDAVRYSWKMSKERAEKAELVLAVERGIIVDVFVPYEWKQATPKNFPEMPEHFPERLAFVGKQAEKSVLDMYVGKRIPKEFRKKGASNPVKYNF
jgi:hypothetical protein